MANELAISLSLTLQKNGATTSISSSASLTVSGNASIKTVISVGTSWEAIALGDVTAPLGMMFAKNLDATNYVELSYDTGTTAHVKMKAGEPSLFRPSGTTLHARANTAAVLLEFFASSD